MKRFLLIAASLATLVNISSLQADQKVGTITGRIVNSTTLEPLPGASVMVVGTQLGAATNINGEYTIKNVPTGVYSLRAMLIGFEANARSDVVVDPVRPVEVDFQLKESAIEYNQVVVTPDYFPKAAETELSTQIQSGEEIRRLPGGYEDVVRAISILPGVAQAQNGRNDLIIRGGAPSENLYIVEGLESSNINHFGTQGASGGPLSFINLDYVDQTSFSTGGFGARYGDKLSSVLTIDLRNGRRDRFGGKGTISASQFGLDLEGPVSDNGSFIFSARRSYLDFIFKAAGFGFVPEYWDFLAKTDYRLNKSNQFNILAIGAIDNVKYFNDTQDNRYDNSRVLGSDQNQVISGATWRHLLGKGYADFTFGQNYTYYYFQQNDSLLQPIFRNKSNEYETYLKTEVIYKLGRSWEITTGAKAKHINFDADLFLPPIATDFGDTLSIDKYYETGATKGSGFTQISYSNPRFRATLGGRFDYFDLIEDKLSLAPRFSGSLFLSDKNTLNLSIGRYYQAPSYIWLVANPINRDLSYIGADQYVIGLERLLRPDTKVSLEAYYKRYFDYPASLTRPYLVLANTGAGYSGADEGFASFGFDPLVSEGKGWSRGLELFVQKKLSEIPCYGLVSISYVRSEFEALDGVSRPGSWDQRWIINIGGGYIFNEAWEIGTRFRLATGRPYTPFNSDGTKDIDNYNTERVATNHSLDLRVDRRWMFTGWMLVTYVDIQNIYNRAPKDVPRWDDREMRVDDSGSIGILPSIGVAIGF
jgi:hypothetical protein